jgi:hypothetical protein
MPSPSTLKIKNLRHGLLLELDRRSVPNRVPPAGIVLFSYFQKDEENLIARKPA